MSSALSRSFIFAVIAALLLGSSAEAFRINNFPKCSNLILNQNVKASLLSKPRLPNRTGNDFWSSRTSKSSSAIMLKLKGGINGSANDEDDSFIQTIYGSISDRPVLAILDFTALMIFSSIGKASHSADGALDPLAVGITAFPFLLSWFAVAPVLGLFNADATPSDTKDAIIKTTFGWAVAVPLGIALRGLIRGYMPPTPFIIVALISTWVILVGERVVYSKISEKVKSD